jgi:hypothetical protein
MDESWLLVLEFLGDIPGETEVRVLVDSTWDQAGDVANDTEDMGEAVGE